MPNDYITHAFVAGEVAPAFRNRSDLNKYGLGLSKCLNYFVDYRGGVSNRPGSTVVGPVIFDDKETRLQRFRASGNDFLIEMGDQYFRFVRNGGYILEAAKSASDVTLASIAEVTLAGHGYSDGDLVYVTTAPGMAEIVRRYFLVGGATTNTFELYNPDGSAVDSAFYSPLTGAALFARVYTLSSPYLGAQVEELDVSQDKLDMVLAHPDQPRRKLTYVADTNWTLTELTAGPVLPAPTNPTITPSASGSAGYAIQVTAVNAEGEESAPSELGLVTNSVNFTVTSGSATYSWTPVPGAVEYNVYRTLVLPDGSKLTKAQEAGYIGRAVSPPFEDVNITPDFTKTAPVYSDPFAHGVIAGIEITAGGTGYTNASAVTVTGGGGSGFVGYPIVSGGAVTGVAIVNGGSGYTAPVTVSFTVGTGATATATVGPADGNYPATTERFQQRQTYGGSHNRPLTIVGSKPKSTNNFDVSSIVNDGDSYRFTVDSPDVVPIKHMLAIKNSLLVFTSSTIYGITGGEGVSVTPLNAQAETQAYRGISDVKPLPIDLNVLYTQEQGSAVYAMTYTYYTESFQQQDISVLSSHLIGEGRRLTRLEFMQEPGKLLYATREDGKRLTCAYVPEQEVYAWAQEQTRGLYRDCCVILEDSRYVLYQTVDRYINGSWVRFLERQDTRTYSHPEDSVFVDCGLRLPLTTPDASLTFSANSGEEVLCTLSATTSLSVGDIIYAGGGKFEITAVYSGTSVEGTWLRAMQTVIPEDTRYVPLPVASGSWSTGTPATSIGGLWHLEGEAVVALADGDVVLDLTVSRGTITLPVPATKVVVGIPYVSRIETLPPTSTQQILEGSRKSVYGAAVRFNETRGAFVGAIGGDLYEVEPQLPEYWGDEVEEDTGVLFFNITDNYTYEAGVAMEQRYPLPSNILGFVLAIDKGDD